MQPAHGRLQRPGRPAPAREGAQLTFWKSLKEDRAGTVCLAFIVLVALAGLLAPWIAPCDPTAIDVRS
ncbi:MAG: hypothetical protein II543_01140, partial [Desulfovibrio sp.]|nr:hypothetical protein [Desulfovibrio sp.]